MEFLKNLEGVLVNAIMSTPKKNNKINLKVADDVMKAFSHLQREMKLTPYLHCGNRWAPPGCVFRRSANEPLRMDPETWDRLTVLSLDTPEEVATFTENFYRELREEDIEDGSPGSPGGEVVEEVIDLDEPSTSDGRTHRPSSRKRPRPVDPVRPAPATAPMVSFLKFKLLLKLLDQIIVPFTLEAFM